MDDDLALAVDGTFGLFEALGIIQQRPELSGVHQQADGLEGVSHDVFGLGVQFGLLMQEFDTWHLTAALWHFDAVADHDTAPVDAQRLRE